MVNPFNDDLGGSFFNGQNRKKADKEPANTYHEADNHLWNLQQLYGRQEPVRRFREGRPVRADTEQ